MKPAMFSKQVRGKTVQCGLCPHACVLKPGEKGKCGVRQNVDGVLMSLNYGKIIARSIDPIEKKPLFHFSPGSWVYSFAAPGCNFTCKFCQNWKISQDYEMPRNETTPEQIVESAVNTGCQGIAYTYTEPTIFFEFALETAKLARKKGLFNVWVSNGFTQSEPIKKISRYLDAANIDIKGDDNFYKKMSGGRLQPVLDTIKNLYENDVWIEITNLLIPGENDTKKSIGKVVDFIAELSPKIPLHFSRFHSDYKWDEKPTPQRTIEKAVEIGRKKLKYVYGGNISDLKLQNTLCPRCKFKIIERKGNRLVKTRLNGKQCINCGEPIDIAGKL